MTAFTLRPTRIDDVAALPAIERAAGQRFRDVPELARWQTMRLFLLKITSVTPDAD